MPVLAIISGLSGTHNERPDPAIRLSAKHHQVERAPFFLVEDEAGKITIYDVYFKLKKELIEKGLLAATKSKV